MWDRWDRLGPIVKKNGPSHFNKDGETFNQSKKMGPMGPIILFRNILFFFLIFNFKRIYFSNQ